MGRRTSRRIFVPTLAVLTAAGLAGCTQEQRVVSREGSAPTSREVHSATTGQSDRPNGGPATPPPAPEAPAAELADALPGLHNVFAVTPGVFSGSGPESEEAFDSLRALGVRTVVSVDGARPEIEIAHARRMCYVHIPVGYDGIEPRQALELTKAIESMPGPVYVHCHHGKHRGPTAAAIALVGVGAMTNEQAAEFMKAAGTAESYPGLWECVRAARPASVSALASMPGELPEVRMVSGLVEGMVAIDKTWERMKLVRTAGWATPADHPDVAPAAEAGILADHFRTLVEDEEAESEGEEFVRAMRTAMERASALEASLAGAGADAEAAERAYKAVADSCTDCHERWRN